MPKYLILTIISSILSFSAQSQSAELEDGSVVLKNKEYQVTFTEEDSKQYLLSKNITKNAEVKKLEVWPAGTDGRLKDFKLIKKQGSLQIIELTGSDGDYSFFEVILWNESNGEIWHLVGGDSFDVTYDLSANLLLSLKLKQVEEAQDYGSIHLKVTNMDKICSDKISTLKKIADETNALIKKAGPVPKGADSQKLIELSKKKSQNTPTKFQFNLKDLKKIQASCE